MKYSYMYARCYARCYSSDKAVYDHLKLFNNIILLFNNIILLVIPAANVTSERTLSALRRVKTYLRSTMTQTRKNNLITLHVHKERTDALDLNAIANEFTARNERRRCVFGKF